MSKIFLILLLTTIGFSSIKAQETDNPASSPQPKPAAKKEVLPVDRLKQKLSASRKNGAEYTAHLAELLNKFPYHWQNENFISLQGATTKNLSVEETRNLIAQLIARTEQIPKPLRALLLSESGAVLSSKNLSQEALDLSQKAADSFNEADYIEFRKKVSEQTAADRLKENPDYKGKLFDADGAKNDFQAKKVSIYTNLGDSLWATGKFESAEKAYLESFTARESKESALGIAKALEKTGKNDEALKYATIAALTGRMQPDETEFFHSVYAKQHQGKTDGVEKHLDAEYKKTYSNPIRHEEYRKSDKRSNRIVLAEFFTGAGCKPCVGVDMAFDLIREDYSNRELSLLVYHANIPVNDPLSNYSVNSREKYYGINYAPKVYIDGKEFKDDLMTVETDEQRKQRLYDTISKDIKSNLETAAEAEIKLKAKQTGQIVKVNVSADKIKNVSDDTTLHIALVENETSYSGENSFRFHAMVVRALAGDQNQRIFGYKIDSAKANKYAYTFDVDDIIKRNYAYYDTSVIERREEYKTKYAGMENAPVVPDYKYRKNTIDSKHLSVVAFLQDNKTKRILQSAIVNLAK